jgi:hypothetical protein
MEKIIHVSYQFYKQFVSFTLTGFGKNKKINNEKNKNIQKEKNKKRKK